MATKRPLRWFNQRLAGRRISEGNQAFLDRDRLNRDWQLPGIEH